MSDQKQTKPSVPEGRADYYTTRQKAPTDKGFVGYETIWEPWQKEAKYSTPKRP
jgi:hypothetical protein